MRRERVNAGLGSIGSGPLGGGLPLDSAQLVSDSLDLCGDRIGTRLGSIGSGPLCGGLLLDRSQLGRHSVTVDDGVRDLRLSLSNASARLFDGLGTLPRRLLCVVALLLHVV